MLLLSDKSLPDTLIYGNLKVAVCQASYNNGGMKGMYVGTKIWACVYENSIRQVVHLFFKEGIKVTCKRRKEDKLMIVRNPASVK